MEYRLTYKPFGERSILIEWPKIIDKDILNDVLSFKARIKETFNQSSEVTHAYNALLVVYSNFGFDFENEVDVLRHIYKKEKGFSHSISKLWKIPVCYDTSFGIDIEALANSNGLSINGIIRKHTAKSYTVYFIGFLPGFLYLGGLDELLHTPRKASPRLKIAKGSVAIGGNQTGVYPNESPGGWNIIGNSPIEFFDVNKEVPCFASAGDQIQFYPISKKEHVDIKTLMEAGVYQIESEVLVD